MAVAVTDVFWVECFVAVAAVPQRRVTLVVVALMVVMSRAADATATPLAVAVTVVAAVC